MSIISRPTLISDIGPGKSKNLPPAPSGAHSASDMSSFGIDQLLKTNGTIANFIVILASNCLQPTSSQESDLTCQIEAISARIHWDHVCALASSIKGQRCTHNDKDEKFSGGCNVIYRLTFDDGIRWALRVPHSDIDVGSTTATMEYVKSALPSIPMASIYSWSESADGDGVGVPYILMDWIEGSTLTWTPSYPPPEAREKVLAQLAQISVDMLFCTTEPSESSPGSKTTSTLSWTLRRINSRLRRIFNGELAGFDPIDCLIYRAMAEEAYLVSSWDSLPFPLMHTDLTPWNVIVDDEFNIVGILDWDDWALRLPLQFAILYPALLRPGDEDPPYNFMRIRDRFCFYKHFSAAIRSPSRGSNSLMADIADQMLPILANNELNAFHMSINSKGSYAYWVKKYLPRAGSLDPQAAAAATRALDAFLDAFPEMADHVEVTSTRARLASACSL